MKKAIVTGANGFVGSAVVRELLKHDIEVLALGRKPLEEVDPKRLPESKKLIYVQIDSSQINSLPEKIKKTKWTSGNSCVFYNFAWSGNNGLTDGTIKDQLKNVTYSANSVVVAKKLGCIKFVNAGTIEETFVEKYLEFNWQNQDYHSSHGIYANSKLAARDMCKLNAYLCKIDYIHTRFSVLVDDQLSANSFVHTVLKRIKKGESYNTPQNNQLFDILPLEEGAKAYYLIGEKGVNKADYYIGSGKPKTLSQYFDQFKKIVSGSDYNSETTLQPNNKVLGPDSFSIDDLMLETGFTLDITFENFIKKIAK